MLTWQPIQFYRLLRYARNDDFSYSGFFVVMKLLLEEPSIWIPLSAEVETITGRADNMFLRI